MDDGKENGEVKVFCTGGEKIHNLVIEGARNFATDHWRAGCGARCTSHLCSLLIDPGHLVSWAHVMLNLQSFAEARMTSAPPSCIAISTRDLSVRISKELPEVQYHQLRAAWRKLQVPPFPRNSEELGKFPEQLTLAVEFL